MDSDSENEYWDSVSALNPDDFSAVGADIEDEPPHSTTIKTPLKAFPEQREVDTHGSRRTAAGLLIQTELAPSPLKALPQPIQNPTISPVTTARDQSSARLTPPQSPAIPNANSEWDADYASSPASTGSFLPSRDTRDIYDELLRDAFDKVETNIIVHHSRVRDLDKRRIAYGVQLELARGVQQGRWTWANITPSRMNLLKGTHAEVMPNLNTIMDCGHIHDPVHHESLLWEEFDREQKAIVEDKGRGLGLQPGTFHGADEWFGGRIQVIVRIDHCSQSSRPPSFILEPPKMKHSYALARELGSRRLLVLKTAPHPPANATRKPEHYEQPPELFSKKFVLMGRVFMPFHASNENVYAVETDEDFERDALPDIGDGLRQPFWAFIMRHNPLALNYRQPVSKWAAKFNLSLATSIPVLEFADENIDFIEDAVAEGTRPNSKVPTEKIMTDGIAFMNGSALSSIARRIHLASRPVAVQGRIAGSKGLWILHPTDRALDEPPRIWIRRSQHKVVLHELCRADRIFALVQPARVFAPGHLGMQTILNMAHNGVPASAFQDLLEEGLRAETAPFTAWDRPHVMPLLWAAVARAGSVPSIRLCRMLPYGTAHAMGLVARLDAERLPLASGETVDIEPECQRDVVELDQTSNIVMLGERCYGPPDNPHETVMELIQSGFTPQESGYLYNKLRFILKSVIEGYVGRYRILVPRSAQAYIVADPFGYLAEDEVHFRSSKELGEPLEDSQAFVVTGNVLISRYPTTVASDIRKVRAVSHFAYESYVDLIILPTRGSRSFLSWLGGGDYDDHMATITWEPSLVEPFKNAPLVEPQSDFIRQNLDSSAMTVEEFCEHLQSHDTALGIVLIEALLSGLRDWRGGLYARFYNTAIWKLGYTHPETERLAHMFSACLNANKTGLHTLRDVFMADDRAWKLQNIPACMTPQTQGAYSGFAQKSSFILDLLRRKGQNLEKEFLGAYDKLAASFPRDDALLEPARRAELYAHRMQRDLKLSLWVEDLGRLRDFVESIRKEWPSAAWGSPRKPPLSEEDAAAIDALTRRFHLNAPQLASFTLYSTIDLAALRVSLAYAASPPGHDTFAFAVAFRDLCYIKARSTDVVVIARSLADSLTMTE